MRSSPHHIRRARELPMKAACQQQGLSLIEVLIAVVVIAVGLLGMAGLQTYSLRNNTSAYHRSLATRHAYELLDNMRANRVAATAMDYEIALGAAAPSGSTIAAQDLISWRSQLAKILPSGTGAVDCDATNVCTVTIQWDDSRGLGEGATQQVSLSSQI